MFLSPGANDVSLSGTVIIANEGGQGRVHGHQPCARKHIRYPLMSFNLMSLDILRLSRNRLYV